jgi:glycine cleavage system transcriptional repressor
MRSEIVLTLSGPDRVGIVEDVTKALLRLGANVETSRMARLGGEFAMLMLLSLSAEQLADLDPALAHLVAEGYRVNVIQTEHSAGMHRGRRPYRIGVRGADHEGIIHEIAHGLSLKGINIESMETGTSRAPNSGTPLFSMTATVAVPSGLSEADWTAELNEAAHQANVDVTVSAAEEAAGA